MFTILSPNFFCLNKKVLLYFSKHMYPLIEKKTPTLYINKIINKLPDPISRMSLPPNNWISLARDTSPLFSGCSCANWNSCWPSACSSKCPRLERNNHYTGSNTSPGRRSWPFSFVLGTPEKLFASILVQGSQAFASFNCFEKKEQWETLKQFSHVLQILGLHAA